MLKNQMQPGRGYRAAFTIATLLYSLCGEAKARAPKLSQFAQLSWEGNSKKVLQAWPKSIKQDFGLALLDLQQGLRTRLPTRPMSSVGSGVFELKDSDAEKWYRVLYLARIGNTIHILHSFTKDTAKTERNDIYAARQQLKIVHERMREQSAK